MEPRGLRNNNPGNIEWGRFAQGQGAVGSDGRFAIFPTPAAGIGAMHSLLGSYHRNHDIDTIDQIIGRWAPAGDGNNVDAYVAAVSDASGFGAADPLDMTDPSVRSRIIAGMIQHENGRQPFTMEEIGGEFLDLPVSRPLPAGVDPASLIDGDLTAKPLPPGVQPEQFLQLAGGGGIARPLGLGSAGEMALAPEAAAPEEERGFFGQIGDYLRANPLQAFVTSAMLLDPRANGYPAAMEFAGGMMAEEEQGEPYTDIAKARADLKAGRITEADFRSMTAPKAAKPPVPYTQAAKIMADRRAGLIDPQTARALMIQERTGDLTDYQERRADLEMWAEDQGLSIAEALQNPSVQQWLLNGKTPSRGLRFSVDENGNPVLEQGGSDGFGLSGSVTTQVQKDLIAARDNLSLLESIHEGAAAEMFSARGRAEASLGSWLDYANSQGVNTMIDGVYEMFAGEENASKRLLANNVSRSDIVRQVNQFFNNYRVRITGAAAGVQEMAQLRASIVNEDMGPAEFMAALDRQIFFTRRTERVLAALLENGIERSDPRAGEIVQQIAEEMPMPSHFQTDAIGQRAQALLRRQVPPGGTQEDLPLGGDLDAARDALAPYLGR